MAELKVEIINLRDEKPSHDYDVRIHRGTHVGNPFKMLDETMRDEVCDKYDIYFYHQMSSNGPFIKEITRIQELLNKHGIVRLFCWCVPLRCHGETVKKFLLHD